MKIQLVAFSAILSLCTATAAFADDDLEVDNDSTNAVAIGGYGGNFFGTYGGTDSAGGSSFSNKRALAGSVLVKGCDCDDDVTIDNTSVNALAVGKAISGSVVLR